MAFKKLKLWFDQELAESLADKICLISPDFNTKKFVKNLTAHLDELELKARVELMADHLHLGLEQDYPKGIAILLKIIGPENETGMFSDFYWIMPIAKYVEKYGLEHFDISMNAISEITRRNTSEYAIRPFIEKNEKKTMKQMLKWSKHPNSHVRRLSCEGARPRLPWAIKIDKFVIDPSPLIPILNNLKDDSSKYVQKSVANCINDILKDNLPIGKQLIEDWKKEKHGSERKWIIKHALRNLLKSDDAWANKMIG